MGCHIFIALILLSASILRLSAATTSLYLYSGSLCEDPNPRRINGTDDGLCTKTDAVFWSFQIKEIDPGCSVTVYSKDNEYCGLGYKYALNVGQCYGNDTSINQFTVDCQSTDITPNNTTSKQTPTSGTNLSRESKIALVITVPCAIIFIIILVVYLSHRWKRRRDLRAHLQLAEGKDYLIADTPELHGVDKKVAELYDPSYLPPMAQGKARSPVELDGTDHFHYQEEGHNRRSERWSWIRSQRWSWLPGHDRV